MITRHAAAILISSVLFLVSASAEAIPEEFKNFLNGHREVRIYVEFKNLSGDDKIDSELLKGLVEKALEARKTYTFIIVKSSLEADIILKGNIVEYSWSEIDPLDQLWGAGPAAMDAAVSDNYACMQIETQLIMVKHRRIIWSDRVNATVTKHVMAKDSSYELVYNRFVKSLMIELFKKRST